MIDRYMVNIHFRGGPLDGRLATVGIPMEAVTGSVVGIRFQPNGIAAYYEIQDGQSARAFDTDKKVHPNLALVARFVAGNRLVAWGGVQ